uniref:Spidroin-1-like n=1 Tax=Saccoglossus kowalevskii TaxID=10224 RepID=A0ABM0MJZ3_SACKO|nr:PREDICTED: spidroin-1-like [Saccoglossus kowalevskii]
MYIRVDDGDCGMGMQLYGCMIRLALNVVERKNNLVVGKLACHMGMGGLVRPFGVLAGQGGMGELTGQGGMDELTGQGGMDELTGQGGMGELTGQGGMDELTGQGGMGELTGQGGMGELTGQGGMGELTGQGGMGELTGQGDMGELTGQGGMGELTGQGGMGELTSQGGMSELTGQGGMASREYDSHIDEFNEVGFTALPSKYGIAPIVKESPLSLECSLYSSMDIGKPKYGGSTIIVGKIVCLHINETSWKDNQIIPETLQSVSRLGSMNYGSGDIKFSIIDDTVWSKKHW